ncbi:MAG: ABC transporter substrate-binding protein [Oscillospiraceae bacterium]|nr:ABC transporter substrate-binding protein [Oscillospiraceae bacterium]
MLVMVLTLLSSCRSSSGDGGGYIFRANLAQNPQNLDPQLAEDASSKEIIMNTFAGLVRFSDNGNIEAYAAQSYSVSEDGLTYSFKLRENIFWMGIGEYTARLTAHDFVFAFERILKEGTFSPHAERYSSIKNVYAEDDFTLIFELNDPYYKFIEELTHTSASPCNKEFFEMTRGRYGLAADAVLSCGAFFLKDWNFDPFWHENFIILQRNSLNNEQERIYPAGVSYTITGDETIDAQSFKDNSIDCFVFDGYDKRLISSNSHTAHQSKAYGLLFNLESDYWSDYDLRYSLALMINREEFTALPENLSAAYGLIPGAVTVLGRRYRELVSDASLSLYDPSKSNIWSESLRKRNIASVENIRITVPDGFNGDLSIITQQWQKAYGFFCGIEPLPQREYDLRIKDGSFEIALVELKGAYNAPVAFFNGVTNENNRVKSIVNSLNTADKLSEAVSLYKEAESLIISDCVYIPLFYGNEYFIYKDGISSLVYYPFTRQVYFGDGRKY